MYDGFIIVDAEEYIVTINPVAQEILADLPIQIDKPLSELLAAWPALLERQEQAMEKTCEIEKESPNGKQYYQLLVTILHLRGLPKGKILILKEITEQKKNQEQLLDQQKALSILQERGRMSRELHDGQGQIWNYLALEITMVSELLQKREIAMAQAQLYQLLGIVQEQNDDVRESIVGLRCTRANIADKTSYHFIQNLQEYLHWYENQHNIAVNFQLPHDSIAKLLRHTSSIHVLRIIQEALTNVRKHAKATQVTIQLQQTDRVMRIHIADNGCGFDVSSSRCHRPKSFGLQIMQERAQESGGQLTIQSTPGVGTEIILEFKNS